MRQMILVQSLAKRHPAQLGNGERIPNGIPWPSQPPSASAHFLEQIKHGCYFSNGTERMRFVHTHPYWEEYARFHSDVGKFRAVEELERRRVQEWKQPEEPPGLLTGSVGHLLQTQL
ncbi:DLA class II histocompatibility antigen, DR-1 beta chain-like isoform X1 [Trachypithecus francoisi]|uniref:DLA class II histocompatibility antigen, DR-1 beta chain-like isoform X1 n=1 Tax=Trachypithecus francoisi TaxID=54180 RepID=UPI00141AFA4C|nr:DLA class II histocompatibility antigen, DR-1 beta chain-like isoform X1 [Trachypithecus francoisi]